MTLCPSDERQEAIYVLNWTLRIYKSGFAKPERESALLLYEKIVRCGLLKQSIESEIRKTVKDEIAVKLFYLKEDFEQRILKNEYFK
jgi:hypothetical protein